MSLGRDCAKEPIGPRLLKLPTGGEPLHRLAEVRQQQGVSHRAVARRLETSVAQVKIEERETTNLPLSRLYQWRDALDVPITELLVEAGDGLSSGVRERARLVRVMKTVLAIQEQTGQTPIRRMAQTLIDQLVELMPELEEVGPWHHVGQRRQRNELGVAAQRQLADEAFLDETD